MSEAKLGIPMPESWKRGAKALTAVAALTLLATPACTEQEGQISDPLSVEPRGLNIFPKKIDQLDWGDSITTGQGADGEFETVKDEDDPRPDEDVTKGENLEDPAMGCLRKTGSYVVGVENGLKAEGFEVNNVNTSCTGANSKDVSRQIASFPVSYREDVDLAIGTGGGNNDGINFRDIVTADLAEDKQELDRLFDIARKTLDDSNGYSTYQEDTEDMLRDVAEQLPNADRIVLVGYRPPFNNPLVYEGAQDMSDQAAEVVADLNSDTEDKIEGQPFMFVPNKITHEGVWGFNEKPGGHVLESYHWMQSAHDAAAKNVLNALKEQ